MNRFKLSKYAKIGLIIGIMVLLATMVVFAKKSVSSQMKSNFKIVDYTFQGQKLRVYVADTPAKWEEGLMYAHRLDGVDGMLFIFPDKQIRSFWNKNTYLALDVYWIDGEKIVGMGYLPSINRSGVPVTINSKVAVDKVLEKAK